MKKEGAVFRFVTKETQRIKNYFNIMTKMLLLPVAKCVSLWIVRDSTYKNLWIISERGYDARDNGYFFYKYIKEHHPEVNIKFIIDKRSSDCDKILALDSAPIYLFTLNHYVSLFLATCHIGAHSRICLGLDGLERGLRIIGYRFKAKQVFVQHGIIKSPMPQLYSPGFKVDLFISGAKPEYDFLTSTFLHPKGVVRYTGLSRFDNLHQFKTKRQILLMPTWRIWLSKQSDSEFCDALYYKRYAALITSDRLGLLLEARGYELVFYPHYEVHKRVCLFEKLPLAKGVRIARFEHADVQNLLKESALLITDYSSVYFDFAYMKKPIVHYLFDADQFFSNHYKRGYFNEQTDGFGKPCYSCDELLDAIENLIVTDMVVPELYQERMSRFFELHDQNNNRRIYNAINALFEEQ